MSQVKPGDLAVVVAPTTSKILGMFVRVVGPWDGGLVDGYQWTDKRPGPHVVIELARPVMVKCTTGQRRKIRRVPYVAAWLQPIRGVPVTEEQHEEVCA